MFKELIHITVFCLAAVFLFVYLGADSANTDKQDLSQYTKNKYDYPKFVNYLVGKKYSCEYYDINPFKLDTSREILIAKVNCEDYDTLFIGRSVRGVRALNTWWSCNDYNDSYYRFYDQLRREIDFQDVNPEELCQVSLSLNQ